MPRLHVPGWPAPPANDPEVPAQLPTGVPHRRVEVDRPPAGFAGDLAPDRRRIPEINGELNAAGEVLEPVQPRPLVLILRPQLQCAPEAACTVAVSVHRAKRLCC